MARPVGTTMGEDPVTGLTPEKQSAVVEFLSGKHKTQGDVAEAIGVHQSKLSYWMNHDPVFRRELRNAADASYRAAYAKLQHGCNRAVEFLLERLDDDSGKTSMKDRIISARAMLDHAARLFDTLQLRDEILQLQRRLEKQDADVRS